MPKPAAPQNHVQLRENAEGRLKGGTAPIYEGTPGAEALAMLHKLASTPASASDALKLLHELQVHQVELDLQREEMERSRQELNDDLERYARLYAFAPVGYFSVDANDKIIEANIAGAQLLGVERDAVCGLRIDACLTATSRPLLLDLLQRRRDGGSRETCVVYAEADENRLRPLQVAAISAPDDQSLFVVFLDTV
ncbi:MAG: PAS domain S-box protein [Spongiibacteraceae bacterium]